MLYRFAKFGMKILRLSTLLYDLLNDIFDHRKHLLVVYMPTIMNPVAYWPSMEFLWINLIVRYML